MFQLVHSGVIRSHEAEFFVLLDKIQLIGSQSAQKNDYVISVFDEYTNRLQDFAQSFVNVSVEAFELAKQQSYEDYGNWTAVCYDSEADNLTKANDQLFATLNGCIATTTIDKDAVLQAGDEITGLANEKLINELTGFWNYCDGDEKCQEPVYTYTILIEQSLSKKLSEYELSVAYFTHDGIRNLGICAYTGFDEEHGEVLGLLWDRINTCLLNGEPKQ